MAHPVRENNRLPRRSPGAVRRIRVSLNQQSSKILRFRRSERLVHWAIAVPFMLCWISAAVLIFVYNPEPLRPYRALLSWIHRIAGVGLILFPPFAIIRCRGDLRVHLYNIRQAWAWTFSDIGWLFRMVASSFSRRISLPEQGKFNAGEKLNFMMVMTTYPLYIITGLLMWFTSGDIRAWLLHVFMALLATPFMLGHIFMAAANPGTRKGLQGMISGYVDRTWARHHYARWYREHFESASDGQVQVPAFEAPPTSRVVLGCSSCSQLTTVTWDRILPVNGEQRPVYCGTCEEEIPVESSVLAPETMQWYQRQTIEARDRGQDHRGLAA